VATSGRRLAFAKHLTSGKHPLVARVLVNRFWMLHFGRGLVATPGDFGFQGERPSHPELLDWLADEFVASGWSLKHLHRLLLHSRAYRQSSLRTPAIDAIDPDNKWLARMSVRRLEAEVVRDSLLAVAGELSAKMDGPPVPVAPDDIGQIIVGKDNRDSAGRPSGKMASLGEDEFRRSLYVQVRRSMPLGVLEPFDMPDLSPNCQKRSNSTVAPQSLLMMNSPFVVERSKAMAQRVLREAGDDHAAQVALGWLLATGRQVSPDQSQAAIEMLQAQSEIFLAAKSPPPTPPTPPAPTGEGDGPKGDGPKGDGPKGDSEKGDGVKAEPKPQTEPSPEAIAESRLAALATLCQALLSSNRFLYID
jgi:hypothetical protein